VTSPFTEDEIQSLRDIFDLFDRSKSGSIEERDLEAIMSSLGRDPKEAKEMLRQIRGDDKEEPIDFEEFMMLM
jgi:Ca2+-binding EF-hand superfamily protein